MKSLDKLKEESLNISTKIFEYVKKNGEEEDSEKVISSEYPNKRQLKISLTNKEPDYINHPEFTITLFSKKDINDEDNFDINNEDNFYYGYHVHIEVIKGLPFSFFTSLNLGKEKYIKFEHSPNRFQTTPKTIKKEQLGRYIKLSKSFLDFLKK